MLLLLPPLDKWNSCCILGSVVVVIIGLSSIEFVVACIFDLVPDVSSRVIGLSSIEFGVSLSAMSYMRYECVDFRTFDNFLD